jgi:uncharacterized protein (DUF4415 family)
MKRVSGIPRTLSKSAERELRALAAMSDDDIDLSDIPEITDWTGAIVGKFYVPRKTPLTVRIDVDVLDWLRSKGAGYQTRLNRILRDAMLVEKPLRVIGSKRPRKMYRRVERKAAGRKRASARWKQRERASSGLAGLSYPQVRTERRADGLPFRKR